MQVLNCLHKDDKIFHRDVKPQNMVIQQFHPKVKIRLLDFGSSRHTNQGNVLTQAVFASIAQRCIA